MGLGEGLTVGIKNLFGVMEMPQNWIVELIAQFDKKLL